MILKRINVLYSKHKFWFEVDFFLKEFFFSISLTHIHMHSDSG